MAEDFSGKRDGSPAAEASYAEAIRLLGDGAAQDNMQRALTLLGSAAGQGFAAAAERLGA